MAVLMIRLRSVRSLFRGATGETDIFAAFLFERHNLALRVGEFVDEDEQRQQYYGFSEFKV